MMSPDEHNRLEEWAKTYAVLGLLGFLSTLLICGKLVHHLLLYRGFVCRVAVIPPAVVSGILGLVWIFVMDFADDLITSDLTSGLSSLKITLVNFVFAALSLGLFCNRSYSQHSSLRAILMSILHEGMPMVIYSQILIWGQSCVCLFISCMLQYFNIKAPSLASAMVPLGIEAGSDVIPTAVYNNEWSKTVVQEAESLGLFASIILGVVALSVKRMYHGSWTGSTRLGLHTRSVSVSGEFEAFGKGMPSSRGQASTPKTPHRNLSSRHAATSRSSPRPTLDHSHSISGPDLTALTSPPSGLPPLSPPRYPSVFDAPSSSLGTHVSLIFLSVFLSFNFGLFARIFEAEIDWLKDHRIISGVRMFEMSIVCSVLIIHTIKKTTAFNFKPEWFMRLSGLMLDMLVIAALSCALPRPERVEQVDYSLVSVYVIACALWNVFAFIFLAKSMFPNFWFERGVTLSGTPPSSLDCFMSEAMGHSFMGLLLVRALDPSMSTPVPAAYLCKLMLLIFPSSGGKNTIVVSLVASHGLYVALIVCICVVVAWAVIFKRFFKMRFVKDEHSPDQDITLTMPLGVIRTRSNTGLGAGQREKKKEDNDDLSDMLEFDQGDEVEADQAHLLGAEETADHHLSDRPQAPFKVTTSEASSMVGISHLETVASWLPSHEVMNHLNLLYSLQRDGASTESLLNLCSNSKKASGRRSLSSLSGSSCIVLIEDSWGYIFGAYLSHGIEDASTYYGNGENFVFSLVPTAAVYKWTGMNDFFVLSNSQNIAFGGGGEGFSIHLDDELNTGVSNTSDTYKNPVLSSNEFFKCLNVEVWAIEDAPSDFIA